MDILYLVFSGTSQHIYYRSWVLTDKTCDTAHFFCVNSVVEIRGISQNREMGHNGMCHYAQSIMPH